MQDTLSPEQALGALGVEDRPGVEPRPHLVGDAAGEVGLDHAGHDVHARALGREQEVDADRARHLREVADRVLDLAGAGHHQVGELVDDDHDERLRTEKLNPPAPMVLLYCGRVGRRRL